MNKQNLVQWGLCLFAAIIMLQTLYFKFTAHPDSVFIFSKMHMEPWGRIGTGVAELIASVLLIVPAFRFWGALLGAGVMGGALVSHLFVLGVVVNNDGGMLFILALLVFLACGILLFMNRQKLLAILGR